MARLYLVIIFIALGITSYAQKKPVSDTGGIDLSNMSIEELSKLKSTYAATNMEKSISQAIEAASQNQLTLRKSPSIITVISDDEIERSGARDMMDVFKLIPGVEFNVDVEGIVGISFRGLWANEGNLLLQIDGQEMNENAYNSLQFGNHYPINQIKKIEVIRGPGSAIYGGSAEYAVINIITKKGDEIKGINAGIVTGETANTYARRDVNLSIGNSIKDLTYSINGSMGVAQRSNLNYTDIDGVSYNMANNSNLNTQFLDVNLSYKGLSLVVIYDNYTTTTRDGYISALSKAYPCDFLSCVSELKYNKRISKTLQFKTKMSYKHSEPWKFNGQPDAADSSYGYYKVIVNRYRFNAVAIWEPIRWLNVNIGIDGYYDDGYKPNGQLFQANNADRVNYTNYAPFAQLQITSRIANVILGARYDNSTAFGSAFNPRLGITKKAGALNFKLLYASSFRSPSIENIQYGLDKVKLKPERSSTLEFETSVKIGKDMYLSANLFNITTRNAIRYFVKTDSVINGDPDGYRNTNKTIGSQGLELEYKYKAAFGFLSFSYSYFTMGNKGMDSANFVPIDLNTTLGNAQHKITLLGSLNAGKYLFITPSVNYMGSRYAYSMDAAMTALSYAKYDPQVLYNLYIGSNTLVSNLSFGIGMNNITDERIIYPQAYNSCHAPLPGMGREFYLKLNYYFSFHQHQQPNHQ